MIAGGAIPAHGQAAEFQPAPNEPGVFSQRLANGKSNTIRMTLSTQAVQDALASPVLGYGDTRQRQGSANSISIERISALITPKSIPAMHVFHSSRQWPTRILTTPNAAPNALAGSESSSIGQTNAASR